MIISLLPPSVDVAGGVCRADEVAGAVDGGTRPLLPCTASMLPLGYRTTLNSFKPVYLRRCQGYCLLMRSEKRNKMEGKRGTSLE